MSKFNFEDGYFDFPCPKGRGNCTIPVKPEKHPNTGASWNFDGNIENPTISPSINCGGCGWHGFIQNGEFKNA